MPYEPLAIVPRSEINLTTEVARQILPTQCNGSFIIPFPAGVRVLPWLPIAKNGLPVADIRLVGLLPSQQIARHIDVPDRSFTRYHVVLRTNDQCWSFSENHWERLHEGMVYRMDPTQPHGAVNWGDTIRLHVMIDVEGPA